MVQATARLTDRRPGAIVHAISPSLCYNTAMTGDRPIKSRSFADRFGASASFLCALHCALLPLIFAALPALGLSFLADHAYERAFVGFSVSLAITSLIFGFRRHRRLVAFLFMIPGVVLLLTGVLINVDHTNVTHAVLVSSGGVLVMCAHIANLRLDHLHTHSAACACPPTLQ